MPNDRPERVIAIDGGAAAPVAGASMDAAIAGLADGVGRVEVGRPDRIVRRTDLTPREARAQDLQTNGFALHAVVHGLLNANAEEDARRFAAGISTAWSGEDSPNSGLVYKGELYPDVIYPSPLSKRRRLRVTVEQWDRRPDALVDTAAYLYVPQDEACDMDPWRIVDSVDKKVERDGAAGAYDVWLADGRCLNDKPGHFPVYVLESHFDQLKR